MGRAARARRVVKSSRISGKDRRGPGNPHRNGMNRVLLSLLPAALLLTSCGETFREVAARHQPALGALRADREQISALAGVFAL